jgi:hypothetical protein
MPKIAVYTKSRLPAEVVSKLVAELEARVTNAEIKVVDAERRGYAVTWSEVVLIFIISEVSKKVIGEVTEAGIEWAKKRFSEEDNTRPKFISLFGPEGVPLGGKSIKSSGEVEESPQAPEGELILRLIERGDAGKNE